jgi:hypothetical protein
MLANKVFVIGFNKTGTTTLHELFGLWGLRSVHECYNEYPLTHEAFADNQCFSDGEQHDFVSLDRAFPDSRFILTTRSLKDWLVSRVRHAQHLKSFGFADWMVMEYTNDPANALRLWAWRRQEYYKRVNSFFGSRPAQLLVVDVCRGGDERPLIATLADYVGVDAGDVQALPHRNESDAKAANTGEQEVVRVDGQFDIRDKAEIVAEVEAALGAMGVPADRFDDDGVMPGALGRFVH